MALNLPEAVPDRLGNSPLKLVVCQIRFEETPAVSDGRVGIGVYEDLGGAEGPYPQLGEFRGEQPDITVAPGAPASTQRTPLSGWRYVSADGNWIVLLLPGSVALETKVYTTWTDDFEARLNRILSAVVLHVQPSIQLRLGLRYVDVITRPETSSPQDWDGLISETLLGPIKHPDIGPGVVSVQQQVDIDLGDSVRCTLRHGTAIDGASGRPGYLLDWDIFTESPKSLDPQLAIETLRSFNRKALRLFQVAITPKMLDELR